VNWCPDCGTAISDLEVKHEDVAGKLYEIRYPVWAARLATPNSSRWRHASGDDAGRHGGRGESEGRALHASARKHVMLPL